MRSISNVALNPYLGPRLSGSSFKWNLKNGKECLFWIDWWFQEGILRSLFPRLFSISNVKLISMQSMCHLIRDINTPFSMLWKRPLRSWEIEIWNKIRLHASQTHFYKGRDVVTWSVTGKHYSTEEAYKLSMSPCVNSFKWNVIWHLKLPPRILIFLWKVEHRILPSLELIKNRFNCNLTTSCSRCNFEVESIDHILWDCESAIWVWKFICEWWSIINVPGTFSNSWLWSTTSLFKGKFVKQVWGIVAAAALWTLWLFRNQAVFKNVLGSKDQILFVVERIMTWLSEMDIISPSLTNLWSINPIGAILLHNKGKSIQLAEGITVDLIGYVDGAWIQTEDNIIKAGVGGFVIDKHKNVVFIFSGPVDTKDAASTELEAASFLLREFISSSHSVQSLRIYSDCMSVISTFFNEKFNYGQSKWFQGLHRNSNVTLVYVNRNLIQGADDLAKQGSSRSKFLKAWC